ncbi:HNH endonuclease signature motif containing protein [Methanocella sp. MCL-LM]|uniref:HNH endonuclease signature motif containing protein n=1 Tax=Methanocella sp. MCL-LM TaxID=3412035 RepID=UPI003C742295
MFENYSEMTRNNLTQSIKDELRQIIPTCEVCRKKRSEDVHHITEVHTADGLVDLNSASNLILVCEDCHHNRIHGEGNMPKSRQRDIVDRRYSSTRYRMNQVLQVREMSVKNDDSILLWIGLGAAALILGALYIQNKRKAAMNSVPQKAYL